MSMTPDYTVSIQRLLLDIGYRYEPLPPYDTDYWNLFHTWMMQTLGPTSTWSPKQLAELEHIAGGIIERVYPHASTQFRLIFAKLTAIATLIDDSIEDDRANTEIVQFSHRLYLGEAQPDGMLALYHATMKELSNMYGDETVLRGLAIVPWINYIDACLIEKQMFTAMRQQGHASCNTTHLDSLALKFPQYLRSKSGISEAYAAGIFKASKDQNIPLQKYIRVLPDLTFFIEIMNDILSFHKEEMAGETYNLIHLRTRALFSTGARGAGPGGEWTALNTLNLLCDEIREATRRIDGLLRLEECERKMRGEFVADVDEEDVEIARQWKGWRHGYISWHLECRRYKLEFLKSLVCIEASVPQSDLKLGS